MPKGKRGPALFELLNTEGGGLFGNLPRLARRPTTLRGGANAVVGDRPVEPLLDRAIPIRLSTRSHDPGPTFAIDGDRVNVSLTPVSSAVVIFVIAATLAVAYWTGLKRGDQAGFRRGFAAPQATLPALAATDEIQDVRNRPPATELIAPLLSGPSSAATRPDSTPDKRTAPSDTSPSPSSKGWVKDLTYIVAQEFPAAAADKARDAQRSLAQKGVDAEIVTLANGALHLITLQGYNHKEPAQKKLADQLLNKIRTIGSQYYAAGGGYRLEGYYKTLKRDHW